MEKYKFNNSGLDLLSLLSVAVAVPYVEPEANPSMMRKGFIENLGKVNLWKGYKNTHKPVDQRPLDDLTVRLFSLLDEHNGDQNWRLLESILLGNIKDEKSATAVEDIRHLLEILNNSNDINGQKFLLGLLKENEGKVVNQGIAYQTNFSNVCRMFLLEPDISFRINDPKMKKDLLFMIGDNAEWMDRFWWYDQMLKQNDLNFDAEEMQSLYDKMLESEHGFVQYEHQKELKYDKNIGAAKKYAEESLKEAKERLDQVLEKEATKTKKEYEKPMTVVREKTREELLEEIKRLRKQNMFLRQALDAAQMGRSEKSNDIVVHPGHGY
jgi:vacuolar-type H+-ATPase subunit H